ncbi:MAG: MBL fold metallo-hydrolase [Bacteroidetes bacterium]|nr:MBL fold metallo-hydrolase [Bacteroidota bacterium]MCL5026299.1 MBL fold metallo-hydrolase [Chloroflexota bacterium]
MVKELAKGIFHIPTTPHPRVPFSHAFLVVGEGKMALVESAPASRNAEVTAGIREAGYDPAGLDYIVPTHIHIDHAGGVGLLAQQLARPTIVLPEAGARHMIDPTRLVESTRQVFGDQFEEIYGPMLPVPRERVWVVRGGEAISLGQGRELRVHASPGHAPHHIVLHDSLTGMLFAGEAAGGYNAEGDVYVPSAAPPSFDPNVAIETYHMIAGLRPSAIVSSHNGVWPEVERALAEAEATTRGYTEVVLGALREGADKVEVGRRLAAYLEGRIAQSPRGSRLAPERRAEIAVDGIRMAVSAYTVYFQRAKLI